jgi:hypothetical protein
MVTIKNINDFNKLKYYNITPVCYVYYKDSLLNSYYVGFTRQNVYKYLKNHHKMKSIHDIFKQGFNLKIYTKYNESALIKLLKPKLNIINGSGILGRNIGNKFSQNLLIVGEVITMTKNNYVYINNRYSYINKIVKFNDPFKCCDNTWDNTWDNLFKNINKVSINLDMVLYIIEINKLKQSNFKYLELLNNELLIKYKKRGKNGLVKDIVMDFIYILKYCKINCLFSSFIILNQVCLNNIKEHELNNTQYLFNTLNNYKIIHNEIIKELKLNNYLISYKNLINIKSELSYLYRMAINENFN